MAGVAAAALMFPFAGGFGLMSNRASDIVANGSAQLIQGDVPQVSTMVDAAGNPIAWLYSQRRFEVATDKIANTMKLAIVSIEDKRFAEHNGVDWRGTLTGLSGYLSGNPGTRGGSTIEQQYVKNYQLLVTAQTGAERRAAVELTPARKLREIRMALTLDKTFSKPEILTRYLNLVFFGNGAFGIQDAAQTYFGINASQLNWQQAANRSAGMTAFEARFVDGMTLLGRRPIGARVVLLSALPPERAPRSRSDQDVERSVLPLGADLVKRVLGSH